MHRVLKEAVGVYRLGDNAGRYPVFSAEGAKRVQGRWHEAGQEVVYACVRYSTALLEKLVYLGMMPAGTHFIEITLPVGTSYEEVTEAAVPGWYVEDGAKARAFGRQWYSEQRSCLLFVPSVVARLDQNVLINTRHPDFAKIRHSREKPVWWDDRLFSP